MIMGVKTQWGNLYIFCILKDQSSEITCCQVGNYRFRMIHESGKLGCLEILKKIRDHYSVYIQISLITGLASKWLILVTGYIQFISRTYCKYRKHHFCHTFNSNICVDLERLIFFHKPMSCISNKHKAS